MPPSSTYAALSYCWGTSTHFTTTSSTLAERCTSISILDMLRTPREASSRMNDAYTNAYLTIVAAASTDCTGGPLNGERICTLPYRGQTGPPTAVLGMNGPEDTPAPSFSDAAGRVSFNRRLLVFTSVGICFVCAERELPTFHVSQQLRLPRRSDEPSPFYWSLLVHDFCAKRMTNPTDKLPTIAGLAKRFRDISRGALGRYYAGL
ncbi:hypothetical protein B0T19DRAFT_445353 [Cercophora scortea]|uniref:Uncharacterized protein n=1 Tax=Cercophora scortea TaxID=314031 RepID=A0AAE0M4W9_9PEZI|nr:hypothetical protein B0T19DRAFT_445353 [Cercophora scortea]